MPRTVVAVLFDFGNTLAAHAPLSATVRNAAAALGLEGAADLDGETYAAEVEAAAHTADELAHPRDLDASVWWERWHVLYGRWDHRYPGLGGEVYRQMHAPPSWVPYPAVAATLAMLRRAGIRIGVVSNTGWDVRRVLRHHGLDGLIDEVLLSYEVGAVKPSAVIFERACEALGALPETAMMVGDDPVADAGAVRVGMRTLMLPAAPPGADNGIGAVARMLVPS